MVRQYFLSQLEAESSLLQELGQFLTNFDCIFSFNGKSFDLPVLIDRFACNRMQAPFTEHRHIDLLYPARRLWKKRLASCALNALEKNILQFPRTDDLPGREMPGLYFEYLREGEPESILPAFHHNRLDILSLVVLAACIGRLLTDRMRPEYAEDWASLGDLWEKMDNLEQAMVCYRKALATRSLPAELRSQVEKKLSLACKRTGDMDQAVALWQRVIDNSRVPPLYPFIELAKYYEHQLRDYERALSYSRRALLSIKLRSRHGHLQHKPTAEKLQHRMDRLEKKLDRSGKE